MSSKGNHWTSCKSRRCRRDHRENDQFVSSESGCFGKNMKKQLEEAQKRSRLIFQAEVFPVFTKMY
jgi:hypothetical protein